MGSIKAIEGDSVHRIHAGQVVLELQQAVKELVENSLDSGATTIEVKIKDHGVDSVEVIDNGSGISEEDWPSIGLKHHTSKLPALSDLPHVTTFGFRGEALSALCALCDTVTVVTATKETAPLGAIIKLGKDGRVIDSSGRIARPRGTTITLTGLFTPLPVRRKEFERTAKREFTKALTTLTSYALVPASVSKEDGREGVRLKVESSAAGKNGKRNALIATDGRGSLRSSFISVWGPKALDNVLDINIELEVSIDRLMAKREGLETASQVVRVSGLISSATWGQGRSSADRQFYYINGRPVDIPVIAKAVNEVYKSFNTHQLPVVVLDFSVPRESVDINVSPDKRSIFLHSEAQLVEALKAALDDFFQPSRSSFTLGGASQKVTMVQSSLLPQVQSGTIALDEDEVEDGEDDFEEHKVPEVESARDTTAFALESQETEASNLEESDKENVPAQVPSRSESLSPALVSPPSRRSRLSVDQFSSRQASSSSRVVQTVSTSKASWSPDRVVKTTKNSKREAKTTLRNRIRGYASQIPGTVRPEGLDEDDEGVESEEEVVAMPTSTLTSAARRTRTGRRHSPSESDESMTAIDHDGAIEQDGADHAGSSSRARNDSTHHTPLSDMGRSADEGAQLDTSLSSEEWLDKRDGTASGPMDVVDDVREEVLAGPSRVSFGSPPFPDLDPGDEGKERSHRPTISASSSSGPVRPSPSYRDEIVSIGPSGEVKLSFDFDRLRAKQRKRRKIHIDTSPTQDAYSALAEGGISSAAGIANKDLASAEEALSRVISKADFERMEVLGQFNKGFIIARLQRKPGDIDGKKRGTDDLFIIDQHASDEKYNFETLQRTTVIKAQSLIRPLQLTAGDEIVAIENLDILRSNGFGVEIDEDKPPGRGERISLSAMPVSKETTFDFKDLEQLLHLLSDGSRPAGQMVRCTKARSMFAMRACRKSVMIGKSLTRNQMVTLLRNMGTIDQPWNCPHGRPTMRHLTKLEPALQDTSLGRIDWANWRPTGTIV